jgi:hypothetical protein
MERISIYNIDDLHKAQVKGYTRTRKGKIERVSPYSKQFIPSTPQPEPLSKTDFELAGKKGKEVILRDKETGVYELWGRSDNFAGYSIDVGGKGYEFLREVKDVSKLESMGVKIEKPLGEPFSATTKEMEHEIHRMSTMEHKALVTRANKIGSPEKLQRFFAVAEKLQRPALQAEIVKIGKEKFGMTNSDFEPFSAWEKKGEGSKKTGTKGLLEASVSQEDVAELKDLVTTAKKEGWEKKGEKKTLFEPETLEAGHQIVGSVSAGKIMSFIHKNIEKIGYDKWNNQPLEERHQQEINWMKDKFKLNLLSPKQLDKIALKLEDENYHGPANYLWRIAGMPYFDDKTKGMMQNEKSLEKSLIKGEVKPFTRTRRGKLEQVKGFHRDVPFGNKEIRGQVKEGRITDIAFKPSETEKWKKEGKVLPIRGNKLIEDIKAGTSPYQKMSLAENYLIDIGGYKLGSPYSTSGAQVQQIGGVDIKNIVKATHPTYKGRKISVSTSIPSQLNSWWDEGHRTYYTFYELATGRTQGTGSNHPMFEATKPRYLSSLPEGVVIVARNYHGTGQSITIYANASDMQATSHPAGALDQARKNFTASPAPIHQPQAMGSPFSTKPSTPEEHQIKIAKDTLKMPQAMAGVMGGPTKEEAKRILSGAKKAKDIGPSLRKDIMKLTEQLSNKARQGGIYENFGQKEIRQLKDKYDYNSLKYGTGEERELAASIDRFDDWASTYSPKLGEPFSNTPTFSTKERTGPRAVHMIAQEIASDWKNPYFGAVPYLNAMHALETIDTTYGADSGASVIAYFLANAQTWKGEKARQIKKELNAMLKTYYKKSMEDEIVDRLEKAETKVKSYIRNVNGRIVNVKEHQRYKLRGMLDFIRGHKEAGASRGLTLRKLQEKFGLSTELAHRVHRLAEKVLFSFPMK